ncbi:MAG TPA: DUF1858 domain-containing protein [Anaerovoracaceae bacterium]|nr:DUF1858 domain-containing protein [Anaerovoracaceae bacterium]
MITREMTMNEVLDADQSIAGILASLGLDCCNCSGAQTETLEEAAQGHGVDLDELIVILNEAIKKKDYIKDK